MSGAQISWLPTRSPDEDALRMDYRLPPRMSVEAPHIHRRQEERFSVVAGGMCIRLRREVLHLGPGHEIVVPARTPHIFWSEGNSDLQVIIEFRPALQMRRFFERLFSFAAEGRLTQRG